LGDHSLGRGIILEVVVGIEELVSFIHVDGIIEEGHQGKAVCVE
jgi:hypothetical protein